MEKEIDNFNSKYDKDVFRLGKEVLFKHSHKDDEYSIWFTIEYKGPNVAIYNNIQEDKNKIPKSIEESIVEEINDFDYDRMYVEGCELITP